MILASLMFQKINSMTKQQIEEAGVGKILNIFSTDLNNLEGKIVTVLKLFVTPFTLIYVSYILWTSWKSAKGLIPLLIILVVYPLINFLQKKRLFYSR